MKDVQVTVDYTELTTKLKLLHNIVDKKEVITAERNAAKMLMQRGRERLLATLKGESHRLKNSFTYRLRKGKFAGVRVGFRRPGGNVAHLVDMGTVLRHTKSGASRGRIIGSHFWTDTKNQYAPQAMDQMMNAISEAIDKINR